MEKISIVVPCYNEEEAIPFLVSALDRIMSIMEQVDFEIIMIDNCSEDETLQLMRNIHANDSRYQYISFSRNFGKDSSMYAGLKYSTGDYVTVMDADLQDPPELLIEMYKEIRTGKFDCVAAYRKNRTGEPWIRSLFAKVFYHIMGKISDYEMVSGARDFRLMTRQVVDAVLSVEESIRFTKGIFSWVGFKTKWIPYENHERIAGNTKLPMKNAMLYAVRGIVAFSTIPLALASVIGFFIFIIAIIYTLYVVIYQVVIGDAVSGYPSLMCVLLFGFGLMLLVLGILGQYVAQIYLEVKHRPKYIVKEKC